MIHFNKGIGDPQTREEVEMLSLAGLHEFMALCDAEPADYDNCLACYAFLLAQKQEVGQPLSNKTTIHLQLATHDGFEPEHMLIEPYGLWLAVYEDNDEILHVVLSKDPKDALIPEDIQ